MSSCVQKVEVQTRVFFLFPFFLLVLYCTLLKSSKRTMEARYNEALEKMKPVDLGKVSNDNKLVRGIRRNRTTSRACAAGMETCTLYKRSLDTSDKVPTVGW